MENLGDIDKSQHGSGQHQRTEVDLGGVPSWANAVLAGAALAVAIASCLFSWWFAARGIEAEQQRAKEYKQIQVQLMYSNAILLREGLARPGDMVFGPEGNLEYGGGFKFTKEVDADGRNSLCNSETCDPAVQRDSCKAPGSPRVRPSGEAMF